MPSRTVLVEITIVLVTVIVPEQRNVTVPPSRSANLKSDSVQTTTDAARIATGSMSKRAENNKNVRDRRAKARLRDLSIGMNDCCNLLLSDNLTKEKSFARGK